MADLSSLHAKRVPAFLSDFAAKHNALCDLIGGIEGNLGIDVHITPPAVPPKKAGSKPEKPKGGKIRVTPKKSGAPNSGTGGTNTTYSTYTFTACVSGSPKTFVIPIVGGPT